MCEFPPLSKPRGRRCCYDGRHFSVRAPHLPTQALRRLYYCQYHKRQCVKFQLTLTHEDIVVDLGMEQLGSAYDKAIFHADTRLPHLPQRKPAIVFGLLQVYYSTTAVYYKSITQKSNPS